MTTRNAALTIGTLAVALSGHAADDALTEARLVPVRKYIKDGWTTLTRGRCPSARASASSSRP